MILLNSMKFRLDINKPEMNSPFNKGADIFLDIEVLTRVRRMI